MNKINKNQPSNLETLQLNTNSKQKELKVYSDSIKKTFSLLGKYEKLSVSDTSLPYAYIMDESNITQTALAALG